FEWQPSLVDVRQQRLYLSIKNNLSLLVQEQTYMDDLQIDLSNLYPEKKYCGMHYRSQIQAIW
ncbi:unnamed protein product, partial [Rotaria sp. Silwood1]